MNALGVKTTAEPNEEAAHVGWDPFIQLNCFVLFQSCDQKSFAEFFTKIMDPDNQKVVPKRDANKRLNLLFSGDFKDADEQVTEDSSDSETEAHNTHASPLSARRTR